MSIRITVESYDPITKYLPSTENYTLLTKPANLFYIEKNVCVKCYILKNYLTKRKILNS